MSVKVKYRVRFATRDFENFSGKDFDNLSDAKQYYDEQLATRRWRKVTLFEVTTAVLASQEKK